MIHDTGRSFDWLRAGLLLALAAVAYHGLALWDPRSHAFPAMVGWFFETSDSSPQVVFGIVALLLFARRGALRDALGTERAPFLAALCVLPAVALHAWAQWVDAPDLSVVSLGLVVLGGGLLVGGRPLGRVLAAPLALLVFAIPLPGALHNLVVYPYQLETAAFVEGLLRLSGADVMLQGDLLTLAGREFEVIETCSGLRSALTLGLLAAAWAVWFRCSLPHALGLLAAALVIAFVTNGIRVLVLVVDPRAEIQESHVAQGVVMFVVGTGLLSLVDRALIRLRGRRVHSLFAARAVPRAAGRSGLGWLAGALAAMAAATLALPHLRPAAPALPPPPELPAELAGWKVAAGEDPGHFLGNVHFSQRSNRVYRRGRKPVAAFLGWDDRQLRMRSLLSEKNAVPGNGWEVEQRGPVDLAPLGPMEEVVARRFAERALSVHAYGHTGSVLEEVVRSALALDRPGSPFARPGRAWLLRLSTRIDPGPDGRREAEERLRSLLAELRLPLERS